MLINKYKGFSLIEISIVIAIIGILATIAVPSYIDYVRRAEVSSALSIFSKLKTDVNEYYNENGQFPSALSDLGLDGTEVDPNGRLESYSISSGSLVFSFDSGGNSDFDLDITYTPEAVNEMIFWSCSSSGEVKYAPTECR